LFLAQNNFKHGDHSCELQVVQTFFKRLVLINDSDVADFAQLVQALDAVLDQLSKLHCALDSI